MTATLITVALLGGAALGFYLAGRFRYKAEIAKLAEELGHANLSVARLEARIKVKDMTIAEKSNALGSGGGSDGGGASTLRSVH